MAHLRRFAGAGVLATLVLAAGLLSLPTSASPPSDDLPATDAVSGATAVTDATLAPGGLPTLPDSTTESTGTAAPPAETADPSASSSPAESTPTEIGFLPSETERPTTASPTMTVPTQASPPAETDDPVEGSQTPTAALPLITSTPSEIAPSPTSPVLTAELPTQSATPVETVTPSPTTTPTLEAVLGSSGAEAASFDSGAVLINEVAWAGTLASTSDEWIELWNTGPDPIALDDWTLTDGGDLAVVLQGEIGAFGFYLLERTDDQTVADITADRLYTGSLNNGGESLELFDPSGSLIDSANAAGGPWPAGDTAARASMERHGALDVPGNWSTFPGFGGNGLDADGSPIAGTPRQPNAPSSPLASPTPSPTPTSSPAPPPSTPFAREAVIINEVAWAGTLASTSDEWIELLNPGSEEIPLDGWTLTDDGDIELSLRGVLAGGGYYVVERGDDRTISDQAADRIYSGALSNEGETLRLLDPTGAEIDIVNPAGGAWPAGDSSSRASMERSNGVWRTFTGYFGLGLDADGRAVRGTPHGPNSVLFPTPLPTWIPGRLVINEVLIRPRHDWEGAGGVTTDDEFIEIYNRGPGTVNLNGWTLDDTVDGGSTPYELPSITLAAGEFAALFRTRTGIALNDSGDSIRLEAPNGRLVDKIRYLRVRAANLSYGRLPDGDDVLVYGLWPTPAEENVRYTPPSFPAGSILINEIAWAGTEASANDEWIELWNPGSELIHLDGWVLTDDNDVRIDLTGIVPAGGYTLLERTDNGTIPDLPAAAVYTGALADHGEQLRLIDPSGNEIDVVLRAGEGWPAGEAQRRATMERVGDEWQTYAGDYGRRLDASGQIVRGTPGAVNSALEATAISEALACDERRDRLQGVCP